eukprot:8690656-Pyramimonas_sp.AAC.1
MLLLNRQMTSEVLSGYSEGDEWVPQGGVGLEIVGTLEHSERSGRSRATKVSGAQRAGTGWAVWHWGL